MSEYVFPIWIENDYADIRSSLSRSSAKSLDQFRSEYARVVKALNALPPEVNMYEIYKISPDELEPYFRDAFTALAHCCEYLVGYWFYRHVYKLKSYSECLNYSLDSGNWLIACNCARNLFEEVAHFDFYLRRVERSANKIQQLEKNEAKKIKQGREPSEKWKSDYVSCDLDIILNLQKAVEGSDFDWIAWRNNLLRDSNIEARAAENDKVSSPRKTHIHDCIHHLEKVHKKPFFAYYDIFSEVVHPNFGSNTLVIITRQKVNDVFGQVTLGSTARKKESACWFFEITSEPLAEVLAIANRNISFANHLYSIFLDRAKSTNRGNLVR